MDAWWSQLPTHGAAHPHSRLMPRPAAPDVIHAHKDFRVIVLANRPGFPFLGHDFFAAMVRRHIPPDPHPTFLTPRSAPLDPKPSLCDIPNQPRG